MNDRELLSAYLDGELSPDQTRDVEARLVSDPRFAREHRRLQEVSVFFRDCRDVRSEPDPGFLVRHRERRDDLSPVLRWTWRELGYRLAAVAALTLIAAGLSVWQAERPEGEILADAVPAVEEFDLLALEDQMLVAPEFEALGEPDLAEEPVLLIALGGGFAPAEGR